MEGLNFTLFRPFNWIGAGLDSIHTPKEGSSRVVTQFFGHIVRGENISLVDGGHQKRAFTDIDDGIDALMKIIENKDGIATGKIYNIGNPSNNYSIRELAALMLGLAVKYPEYASGAAKVSIVETTAGRIMARATRTSRTVCRRSPILAMSWDGRRLRRWLMRSRRSLMRIRGTSQPLRRWWSDHASRAVHARTFRSHPGL
jgi:nucleoside-diphosphate-sugar epimerase